MSSRVLCVRVCTWMNLHLTWHFSFSVHAVVICTPTFAHEDIVRNALQNGTSTSLPCLLTPEGSYWLSNAH